MPQQVKSDAACIREITALVADFHALIRAENVAVSEGDTRALGRIAPRKQRLIRDLEKVWSEYRTSLRGAPPERARSFAELEDQLAELRSDLTRNMALLNAAKIRGATRIEAGLEAWRRKQGEDAATYGRNGRPAGVDPRKRPYSGHLV